MKIRPIKNLATMIDQYDFSGCAKLTSINVPSQLKRISTSAFDGCVGLTELIVPNSCGKIEAGAFKDCSNLVEVHLPDHSLLSNTLQEQYSAFTSINHELFE